MNLCFFSGNIVTNMDFKFIIGKNKSFKKCKHISICIFDLKLENGTIIKIKGYDEMADYCHSNLKKGDYIYVSGTLNDLFQFQIDFCQII